MSLENMASASNEKREQRILQLRQAFNQLQAVTVPEASKRFGYQPNTIIKWAQDGNIPLILDNQHTVVPLTTENAPTEFPTDNPGMIFIKHLEAIRKK